MRRASGEARLAGDALPRGIDARRVETEGLGAREPGPTGAARSIRRMTFYQALCRPQADRLFLAVQRPVRRQPVYEITFDSVQLIASYLRKALVDRNHPKPGCQRAFFAPMRLQSARKLHSSPLTEVLNGRPGLTHVGPFYACHHKVRLRVVPRDNQYENSATIRMRMPPRGYRRKGVGVPGMGTGLEVKVLRGARW